MHVAGNGMLDFDCGYEVLNEVPFFTILGPGPIFSSFPVRWVLCIIVFVHFSNIFYFRIPSKIPLATLGLCQELPKDSLMTHQKSPQEYFFIFFKNCLKSCFKFLLEDYLKKKHQGAPPRDSKNSSNNFIITSSKDSWRISSNNFMRISSTVYFIIPP